MDIMSSSSQFRDKGEKKRSSSLARWGKMLADKDKAHRFLRETNFFPFIPVGASQ